MKRLVSTALCVLAVGVVAGSNSTALAQRPFESSRQAIGPMKCRIQLQDHVTLASGQLGILKEVLPEEGDRIEEGDIVAQLIDDVARAALERAEKEASNDVEIRYAIKAAEVANAEYAKAVDANRRVPGAVPEIEVQRLKLAAERSRLQIEQAQHRFLVARLTAKEAEAALRMFAVTTPFNGTVTRVYKSKGEAVRQGDPILELVNTDKVRVEGYLTTTDMHRVERDDYVSVRLDIPDIDLDIEREVFEGRIVFVDPQVQPVTGQVRVWAEVENRRNILRSGLTALMVVEPGRRYSAKTAANPSDGENN